MCIHVCSVDVCWYVWPDLSLRSILKFVKGFFFFHLSQKHKIHCPAKKDDGCL